MKKNSIAENANTINNVVCSIINIKEILFLLNDSNMRIVYLILIAILLVFIVMSLNSTHTAENFTEQISKDDIIGGITLTKIYFPEKLTGGHTTVVKKLVGNNGETIVLLHNSPFTQRVWEPLFMWVHYLHLQGEKIPTLISYDLLGHGTNFVEIDQKYLNADVNVYPWTYDMYAEELKYVYDSFVKTGKIKVVGFDFGAAVGQAFAHNYPDLVQELLVLFTVLGTSEELVKQEIEYLAERINKHPDVWYLTLDEKFVNYNLCLWFDVNDKKVCNFVENEKDTRNESNKASFLLAQYLYRTGDIQTALQVDKTISTENLLKRWGLKRMNFPVRVIIGKQDLYTDIDEVKQQLKVVSRSASSTSLTVVNGKHGFLLMHPDYIYNFIKGNDQKGDPLTVDVITNFE